MVTFISPQHGVGKAPMAAKIAGWPALYDLSPGSDFLDAVNDAPLPQDVAFTSIYSCTDEYIQPYETSIIPGATNIGLCDGFVGHFEFFYNPEIYMVMHDALIAPAPKDAPIDPAVNVVDVVYREATRALEQLGFAVEPTPSPLSNTLTLEVLQITYDLSSAVMKKTVFVDADVRATAAAGGATYATTYRAHQEQDVAFHPAPALSQRLLNQTVSNALSRAFADPQLMGALTQRRLP